MKVSLFVPLHTPLYVGENMFSRKGGGTGIRLGPPEWELKGMADGMLLSFPQAKGMPDGAVLRVTATLYTIDNPETGGTGDIGDGVDDTMDIMPNPNPELTNTFIGVVSDGVLLFSATIQEGRHYVIDVETVEVLDDGTTVYVWTNEKSQMYIEFETSGMKDWLVDVNDSRLYDVDGDDLYV